MQKLRTVLCGRWCLEAKYDFLLLKDTIFPLKIVIVCGVYHPKTTTFYVPLENRRVTVVLQK